MIFVNELTFRAQQIVGQNFKFFTVFAAAGIIYLMMTSAVAIVQWFLERRFNIEIERPAGARRGSGGCSGRALSRACTSRRLWPPRTTCWRPRAGGAEPARTGSPPSRRCAANGPASGLRRMPAVRKAYGGREVLRGIDLDVARGEVVT